MPHWFSYLRRRRIAESVVLLFCSSLGWAQTNVEHSMFTSNNPAADVPAFIVSLQRTTGIGLSTVCNGGRSTGLRYSGGLLLEEQRALSDSSKAATAGTYADSTPPGKSPGLAMLMSMVVPGSGQIYVHRYFTIPIIWGFGYYFAKAWSDQNKRYEYYRDLFNASVNADSTHQGNGIYQSNRDFYRDDRDKFAFYLAITYVLNIVDAYVGASLYSFDVSDNLGGSAAIRIRIPIQ